MPYRDLTEADIRWFASKSSNSSAPDARVNESVVPETTDVSRDDIDISLPPRVSFNPDDLYYDMSGERILVVFNHKTYEKTPYFQHQRPSERKHTEQDVKSLHHTFTKLGFTITVHHNLRHRQPEKVESILEILYVCSKDHRGTSCIAIAIMTHGDEVSVYAADRPYQLSDVTNLLQNQPGLAGKPKLVFVQACRGDGMDDGRRVQTDGHVSIVVLPTHADTLIMLASAEKHLAYRDSNGSWLMQALCEVLDARHGHLDLLQMITLVNQLVAYRATYTLSDETRNKKMMPETKFTLTKLLKF